MYTALTFWTAAQFQAAGRCSVCLWHVCVFGAELTELRPWHSLSAGSCCRWNVETTSEPCTGSTTQQCMCVARMLLAPPVTTW